jgi:hypothetical protein
MTRQQIEPPPRSHEASEFTRWPREGHEGRAEAEEQELEHAARSPPLDAGKNWSINRGLGVRAELLDEARLASATSQA